jgi:hypothetical protein
VFRKPPSKRDIQQWLDFVRTHPTHQSKPDCSGFANQHLVDQPLRKLGTHSRWLRSLSGFCLPGPETRQPYTIHEQPGMVNEPGLPVSLLGDEIPGQFMEFYPSFSSRESFVLRVPGGHFHGLDHTLFNGDLKLIEWGAPYWALQCGLPGSMFRTRMPKPTRLKGRTLVLSAPAAGGNIWHLLFDSIPKVKLVEEAGYALRDFDHILIDSMRLSIVEPVLEMLGIDPGRVIETETRTFVRCEELVYVTLGSLLPPDPWVLQWLRGRFMPDPGAGGKRKLLITREGANRRRLINEELITRSLEESGFEKIALERLPFQEQIVLLSSARAVVAAHGAGLTNLVWCGPGTRVVELFASEYINVCYWNISSMLGLEYAFAVGDPTLSDAGAQRAVLNMQLLGADIAFPDPAGLARRILEFTEA